MIIKYLIARLIREDDFYICTIYICTIPQEDCFQNCT